MQRYIFPLLLGVLGAGFLVSLGVWQVQRLAWKERMLDQIETRIAAPRVGLPANPDPIKDLYLPVNVSGRFTDMPIRVLASVKQIGAIHRYISAFETPDGRRILVDTGYQTIQGDVVDLPSDTVEIGGNLHWPDEIDSWTPAPDPSGLFFARDVPELSRRLNTEPLLVVLREMSPKDSVLTPLPVDTAGIPNDHLNYAVTWFGLAVVWLGMTGYWLGRIRKRTA